MTEEQIKQNAEEYFNSDFAKRLLSEVRNEELIKEAYIIGAHSRDEEIKGLYNSLEHFRSIINNLRNPWISVENRLPERMTSRDSNGARIIDCCSKDVFGYDASYKIGRLVCYNHESEMWESHDAYMIGHITHWMPIPEL